MAYQLVNRADNPAPYQEYVAGRTGSILFHGLPWLTFITREHAGRLHLLEIRRDGAFFGYWPLIAVRKMGVRLMGSPLRGWLTSHMGPLLEGALDRDLVQTLTAYSRQERIAYLELAGKSLEVEPLSEAGFEVRQRETWVLDIEADEDAQWSRLHHNCRKNIKKAERSDLVVVEMDDAARLPDLYRLAAGTFRKKGLRVPYGARRLELLRDTIGASGQMLMLGAFHQDRFIGGHIWGHDAHTAYALIVGHDERFDDLRVTNKLLWEGIRRFVRMGLKEYDMYGGSKGMDGVTRFKSSFGSRYVASPFFGIAFSPLFRTAKRLYEKLRSR